MQKISVVCAHSDTVMYIRFRGKNRSFGGASHDASEEKCEDVMPDTCMKFAMMCVYFKEHVV